nr:MAG TPA: hypothetical protein [Caudoviricetes sp.]
MCRNSKLSSHFCNSSKLFHSHRNPLTHIYESFFYFS